MSAMDYGGHRLTPKKWRTKAAELTRTAARIRAYAKRQGRRHNRRQGKIINLPYIVGEI
jgi:hypothetical protein